ncbi:FecCD family ABC transporter permease [Ureibacillus acetophenoni]|uniref:Iron complex transport system permease protein n=1 Tax=Ureibacillus acetophenoni TaxID=614649 RepID=A0A285UF87_9BACL|nr:iron chelate uptake ABC transporter family permease subunit [Ureibacillus acetophenoni]SOC40585.1 iron complex transport system permease protein [Ureibacillus acetophenoni]
MNNNTLKTIIQSRTKRKHRYITTMVILNVITFALCCAMLMLGNTIYPVKDVLAVLLGEEVKGASFTVGTLRFPRMLACLLAGFAFGVGGYVFQTMLRNPLANPNVIGITAGSSAAAVFCIVVLQASNTVISIAAVVGGLLTVTIIYGFSRTTSFSIGRLILIGIGIQAMLNAFISYLMLIAKTHDLPTALRWLSGSLNGTKIETILPLLILLVICTPILMYFARHLEMLELGEQAATSLGVSTNRVRIILLVSAVLIIALATATTGPIAFISFLAGPIARRIVGVGFSALIPSGLIGAILVLGADLIGQFAFETRFPVGVITGIIGAPYLIYLLIKMNREGNI